jgi:DNA-directed RNA polymerase specialized sigma24 family protein
MRVDWTYEGCDEDDVSRIETHWDKIRPELEARLEALPEEPLELRVAVFQDDAPPYWQIESALHLPGGVLVTETQRNRVEDALDDMQSGLAEQLDGLAEGPAEVETKVEGLEAVVPLLERSHQRKTGGTFFTFLAPVVASIGPYVQRELRFRESDGTLPSEEVTLADVLDEVAVRAYERFARRPQQLALNLWLIRLAEQILDEAAAGEVAVSLDEEQPEPAISDPREDRDSWTEMPTYVETVELGDLVAGLPGADLWDRLDFDTKRARMGELLGGLPRQQRQTLILSAVEGFSPAEIADFQSRSEQEVRSDIAEARRTIEHYFLDQRLWDVEERTE